MDQILSGLRILVVEDDEDARDMLAHALGGWGADVRVAGSADQARCALGVQTPDIIVSDIGLPEEDGCTLMRSIRSLPNGLECSIPAVALTAFSTASMRARALSSGFDVYLVKPVQPWILAQLIREMTSAPSSEECPPAPCGR